MSNRRPAGSRGRPAALPGTPAVPLASRKIPTAAEIRASPHVCALCGGWSRNTSLRFAHERGGVQLLLEMNLCSACGDRIEKHLKRAIPLRTMELHPVDEGRAGPRDPLTDRGGPAGERVA